MTGTRVPERPRATLDRELVAVVLLCLLAQPIGIATGLLIAGLS